MNGIMIELPPVVGKAFEVIAGAYGVNEERKKKLEQEGFDYNIVQGCVNELVKLINKYSA